MAFSPPFKQAAPAAPETGSSADSVLRQDTAAASKLSDTQRVRGEEEARVAALRTMNAVRMLGPVLGTVASLGGEDEDQARRFAALMETSHTLAVDAMSVMGVSHLEDRNRWMLNVWERAFAEALAKTPEQPLGREMVRAVVSAAKSHALDMPAYQGISEDATVMMARVQALGPVLRAQMTFDFARPRDTTIEEVAKCLDEEVVKAMDQLAEPLAGASERRTLYTVLAEEAGSLMTEAWQHESAKAIAALKKKTQAERDAWKVANPQGLPIDTVLLRFRQNMSRLVKLSKQLRPSTTRKPAKK